MANAEAEAGPLLKIVQQGVQSRYDTDDFIRALQTLGKEGAKLQRHA